MEDKTVWILRDDHGLEGIAASDVEAARMLVQSSGLSLDDEGMVRYRKKNPAHEGYMSGYMSVRQAAKECGLNNETFLAEALRGRLAYYWFDDFSIEKYVISRYSEPLE